MKRIIGLLRYLDSITIKSFPQDPCGRDIFSEGLDNCRLALCSARVMKKQ